MSATAHGSMSISGRNGIAVSRMDGRLPGLGGGGEGEERRKEGGMDKRYAIDQ